MNRRKTSWIVLANVALMIAMLVFVVLYSSNQRRENYRYQVEHFVNATIAMEQFYKTAKNADILIVNSALTDHCDTLEELKGKSPMFQNMKAVQNGSVYITEDSLYQSSMELGDITDEMHRLIQGQDEGLVHFRKLQ